MSSRVANRSRSRSRSPRNRGRRRASPRENRVPDSSRHHKSHDDREPKRHDRDHTHYHKRLPNPQTDDNSRYRRSYRRPRENWRENDTHRNGDQRLEIPREKEREEKKWAGHDKDNRRENRGRWPNKADAHFSDTRPTPDNNNIENERNIEHRRHGNEGGRGNFRGRRSSRAEESVRPVVVNPTEVPKGGKYFTHDNREGRGSGREGVVSRRPRVGATPMKWGHDMFDKMAVDETTPTDQTTPTSKGEEKEIVEESVESRDVLDLPQDDFQELDLYQESSQL